MLCALSCKLRTTLKDLPNLVMRSIVYISVCMGRLVVVCKKVHDANSELLPLTKCSVVLLQFTIVT